MTDAVDHAITVREEISFKYRPYCSCGWVGDPFAKATAIGIGAKHVRKATGARPTKEAEVVSRPTRMTPSPARPAMCPVTGGEHQFRARRSTSRRAAKVTAAVVLTPIAGLLGGKNMGQCSACGTKVRW